MPLCHFQSSFEVFSLVPISPNLVGSGLGTTLHDGSWYSPVFPPRAFILVTTRTLLHVQASIAAWPELAPAKLFLSTLHTRVWLPISHSRPSWLVSEASSSHPAGRHSHIHRHLSQIASCAAVATGCPGQQFSWYSTSQSSSIRSGPLFIWDLLIHEKLLRSLFLWVNHLSSSDTTTLANGNDILEPLLNQTHLNSNFNQ